MSIKKVHAPAAFTQLVGSRATGYDPSLNMTKDVLRVSASLTTVSKDGGVNQNARMVTNPAGITSGQTGTITVADNDFSGGRVELVLGDYRIINSVEYAVGGAVAATATNVAAAISALPGFLAVAVDAVVTVTYGGGPADEVEFRVVHHGSADNFTPLSPATGLLSGGSPAIGAPLFA